jgi:hypothetical protein
MDSPTSTLDLIEKAKGGSGEALSYAFERYQRRLAVLVHFKLSRTNRRGAFCDGSRALRTTRSWTACR